MLVLDNSRNVVREFITRIELFTIEEYSFLSKSNCVVHTNDLVRPRWPNDLSRVRLPVGPILK